MPLLQSQDVLLLAASHAPQQQLLRDKIVHVMCSLIKAEDT
jgi:hypothetical protein